MKGRPLPGALAAVRRCQEEGLRLGLATASSPSIIEAVLDRLELQDVFQTVVSGRTLAHGKPHPEIYLVAMKNLEIGVNETLIIEDSVPGVIGAVASSATCLAVPNEHTRMDPRYCVAQHRLESLLEF